MVAGYRSLLKQTCCPLNGGVVAGFGPMFKTNITNGSNTIVIVLWYYKVVAWWQVKSHC